MEGRCLVQIHWAITSRLHPAAQPDGVVAPYLHKYSARPFPSFRGGGRLMLFVMYAFSNHAVVLHNVTPIDLPAQSVILSDGVVFYVSTSYY